MGMFGKLIGAVIDTAMVPVEIVKDVATLGGAITDEEKAYTLQRLERAQRKVSGAADDAADGDLL